MINHQRKKKAIVDLKDDDITTIIFYALYHPANAGNPAFRLS
jgi:hypothetical protein